MPHYEAVLILGGGVRQGGELPPWVKDRFDRALEVDADYLICLSAGTAHRPLPLGPGGNPIFESVAGAKYLLACGVPARRILVETASYDTIGNAFFSRVIHVDPMGLRNLLVVTSEFHRARTEAIFRWVYRLSPPLRGYRIAFESTPDTGIDSKALHARRNREQVSLQELVATEARIGTLRELHHWIHTEHDLYAPGLMTLPRQDEPEQTVVDTY